MPNNTNNPVNGQPAQQATGARINDLQPIADQDISLSMNFEVDLPNETFRASFLQVVDYIKREVLNSTYLVGDIIETTNNQTPQDRGLTGTWERLSADIGTITTDENDAELGDIVGENNPVVPVPEHNHTVTDPGHGHGISDPGHTHTITAMERVEEIGFSSGAGDRGEERTLTTNNSTTGIGINNSSTGISVDNAGTTNATLNVRGRNLKVIKWIKTAN